MFYAQNGNVTESARLAGYASPQKDGSFLLVRDDVSEYIHSLYKQNLQYLSQKAVSGYERLAFGNVCDAVKLLFADSSENLENYDLFNVAEIKRPKENCMEIKFFDRLKALEKLELLNSTEKSSASDFYNAVLGGLKNSQNYGGDDLQ